MFPWWDFHNSTFLCSQVINYCENKPNLNISYFELYNCLPGSDVPRGRSHHRKPSLQVPWSFCMVLEWKPCLELIYYWRWYEEEVIPGRDSQCIAVRAEDQFTTSTSCLEATETCNRNCVVYKDSNVAEPNNALICYVVMTACEIIRSIKSIASWQRMNA